MVAFQRSSVSKNNGFGEGSAIQQLVNQLNDRIERKKDRYTFVAVDSNEDGVTDEMDSIGTDVITTGVIYRKKVVKLKDSRVIAMPSQQAPEVLDDSGKVPDNYVSQCCLSRNNRWQRK